MAQSQRGNGYNAKAYLMELVDDGLMDVMALAKLVIENIDPSEIEAMLDAGDWHFD